ncbi:MAG: AAA family ATPase [Acidobacteriota bacterium]|jgi:general secretion pathway protein A|nr:AAA family ATPase [Acidobacteriota bacterium]NLT32360.1 AAA family ATPase [Acidobacteriota bacterium]
MYENFYGLAEPAFNLTPDPSFLFLNKRSREAIEQILYSIERREGFAVVVGDIGTGKTTLCWALLERLARKEIRTALIQNPMLSEIEILKSILQDLGVRPEETDPDPDNSPHRIFDTEWMRGMTKKQLLDRLNMFLAQRAEEDVFTVLIIDEAQNMSLGLLEQMRLLSNLETAKKKLLQIIFVGQLELDRKLKSPTLRQLNQRISVRFETKPLSREDTERYVRRRIAVAGGAPRLRFGSGTFRALWRHSKGYPRMINLIADRALLGGYLERSGTITPRLVRRAVRTLQGGENSSGFKPGWFRRLVPYAVPALVLIVVVFFMVYQGLTQ